MKNIINSEAPKWILCGSSPLRVTVNRLDILEQYADGCYSLQMGIAWMALSAQVF